MKRKNNGIAKSRENEKEAALVMALMITFLLLVGVGGLLMESSTEFGTTYIDVLRTVVPTGTGSAVLPTVSGMQPAAQTIDNAPATRIRRFNFNVMIQPRLEFGSNLGRGLRRVFT